MDNLQRVVELIGKYGYIFGGAIRDTLAGIPPVRSFSERKVKMEGGRSMNKI